MPTWVKPWKIRRSAKILSYAVRQNFTALETMGEACFLLKRGARANTTFQRESRAVDTITTLASGYGTDPETGYLRYQLWEEGTNLVTEYPDMGVFTATVQATGSTDVWEMAIDKYSFITDWNEYAFDIYRDEFDSNGDPVPNSVYIVFNTPPMMPSYPTTFNYGRINPLVKFEGMQPIRDTEEVYKRSLFGFEQWLKANARIRSRRLPNRFLLAFPGILSDFTITDAGMLRETKGTWWTAPTPYSPAIVEHDIVVRESTGQRFQVTNYTPIYVEDTLVSQHFDMAELDPRSTIYDLEISDT